MIGNHLKVKTIYIMAKDKSIWTDDENHLAKYNAKVFCHLI